MPVPRFICLESVLELQDLEMKMKAAPHKMNSLRAAGHFLQFPDALRNHSLDVYSFVNLIIFGTSRNYSLGIRSELSFVFQLQAQDSAQRITGLEVKREDSCI